MPRMIKTASDYQLKRLASVKQSIVALGVIHRRISALEGGYRRDQRIDDAFAAITDRLHAQLAATWENIAALSPVDDACRAAIAYRTRTWFEDDDRTIMHLAGFYDAYPVVDEEEFRAEVKALFTGGDNE